jgi:hypothetical protein
VEVFLTSLSCSLRLGDAAPGGGVVQIPGRLSVEAGVAGGVGGVGVGVRAVDEGARQAVRCVGAIMNGVLLVSGINGSSPPLWRVLL